MAEKYEVLHAFAQNDPSGKMDIDLLEGGEKREIPVKKWYTRENAHEVAELPKAVRDQLEKLGRIRVSKETPPARGRGGNE